MDERTKRSIKKNNDRVLKRMKNPDDKLNVISTQSTWYPPRPAVKKDKDALDFGLKKNDENKDEDS
jgi:hypothetical protein